MLEEDQVRVLPHHPLPPFAFEVVTSQHDEGLEAQKASEHGMARTREIVGALALFQWLIRKLQG